MYVWIVYNLINVKFQTTHKINCLLFALKKSIKNIPRSCSTNASFFSSFSFNIEWFNENTQCQGFINFSIFTEKRLES